MCPCPSFRSRASKVLRSPRSGTLSSVLIPLQLSPSLRMCPQQLPPVQQPQVPRISLSLLGTVCEPPRVNPILPAAQTRRTSYLSPGVNVQGTPRFHSDAAAVAGPPSPPLPTDSRSCLCQAPWTRYGTALRGVSTQQPHEGTLIPPQRL